MSTDDDATTDQMKLRRDAFIEHVLQEVADISDRSDGRLRALRVTSDELRAVLTDTYDGDLRDELASLIKARDFQRQRADRGWALYERTSTELVDLREGELLDLQEQLAALQAAQPELQEVIDYLEGMAVSGLAYASRPFTKRAQAVRAALLHAKEPK